MTHDEEKKRRRIILRLMTSLIRGGADGKKVRRLMRLVREDGVYEGASNPYA